MVTAGCCCWLLAKATEKNGASNVDPAPVRVGEWSPGPTVAATTAEVVLLVAVLLQAAAARRAVTRPRPGGLGGRADGGLTWCSSALRVRSRG